MNGPGSQIIRSVCIMSVLFIMLTINTAYACEVGGTPKESSLFQILNYKFNDLIRYVDSAFFDYGKTIVAALSASLAVLFLLIKTYIKLLYAEAALQAETTKL